jgi:hypothetical protein
MSFAIVLHHLTRSCSARRMAAVPSPSLVIFHSVLWEGPCRQHLRGECGSLISTSCALPAVVGRLHVVNDAGQSSAVFSPLVESHVCAYTSHALLDCEERVGTSHDMLAHLSGAFCAPPCCRCQLHANIVCRVAETLSSSERWGQPAEMHRFVQEVARAHVESVTAHTPEAGISAARSFLPLYCIQVECLSPEDYRILQKTDLLSSNKYGNSSWLCAWRQLVWPCRSAAALGLPARGRLSWHVLADAQGRRASQCEAVAMPAGLCRPLQPSKYTFPFLMCCDESACAAVHRGWQ